MSNKPFKVTEFYEEYNGPNYKDIEDFRKSTILISDPEDIFRKFEEIMVFSELMSEEVCSVVDILVGTSLINKVQIVSDRSYRNCTISLSFDEVDFRIFIGKEKLEGYENFISLLPYIDENVEVISVCINKMELFYDLNKTVLIYENREIKNFWE